MALAKQYTPKRRILMQIIMWALLLLTVALAGLASSHRRSVFETRLDRPTQLQGFSIQLPHGWEISTRPDDESGLLLSAIDVQEKLRSVNVWHAGETDTPGKVVNRQLRRNSAVKTGEIKTLIINGHPAAIARGEITGEGFDGVELSLFVGAVVPTDGHGVIVEYHCTNADSTDENLLKRVLESIKFQDQPGLSLNDRILYLPVDFSSSRRIRP